MSRKILSILLLLILVAIIVASIMMINKNKMEINTTDKLKVMVTLYPQYDFVKEIAKDKVDIELILPIGVESHTYEPTIKDVQKISNANLIVYTGDVMEPWVRDISKNIKNEDEILLDSSKNISQINVDEIESKNEIHIDDISLSDHADHGYDFDPHIWLNPENAIIMVKNILEKLCIIDSENAVFYRQNAKEYITSLEKLDFEIEEVVNFSKTKKVVFGGRFAFAYFIDRYNLEFGSVYEGCSTELEPSPKRILEVIKYVNDNKIKSVFYEEMVSDTIIETIIKETKSEKKAFHAIHNISEEEFKNKVTYLELMYKNLKSLKETIN